MTADMKKIDWNFNVDTIVNMYAKYQHSRLVPFLESVMYVRTDRQTDAQVKIVLTPALLGWC